MAKKKSDENKDKLYMYSLLEGYDPILVLTDPNNELKNSITDMGTILKKISKNFNGKQIDGGIEFAIESSNWFSWKSKVNMYLEEFYIPGTLGDIKGVNIKTKIDKGFRARDTAIEQIKNYLKEHFDLREEKYQP